MNNEKCPYHDDLAKKVNEIHVAVCGNESLGHRGIVKRLDVVENKTTRLWEKVIAISAFGAGIGWVINVIK